MFVVGCVLYLLVVVVVAVVIVAVVVAVVDPMMSGDDYCTHAHTV